MIQKNDYDRHHALCEQIHDTYIKKNQAYGNSFSETFQKLGLISAVTRISDKYNRLVNLTLHPEIDVNDESIVDTLADLANYSLMTIMELQRNNTNYEELPFD